MVDQSHIDWFYDLLPGFEFSKQLHQLRSRGSMVKVSALGGAMPVYYIIGHQALAKAFKDGDCFPPGHAYQIISLPFIGETFMSMDEDRHHQWRPPMTPSFKRSAVDKLDEGELQAIGHALLDELQESYNDLDNKAAGIDLVSNFTRLYAFRVICQQLGLPIEKEREYYQWSMDLMFGGRDMEKSQAADAKLTEIVRAVVAARRASPQDDQISRWLETEIEGEPLSEESIFAHIRLFFTAGATTTSDAMSNLFHALLTDGGTLTVEQDQQVQGESWKQCVAEPEKQPNAIQELLRWNPPVAAQPRFTPADREIEFEGQVLPPNSSILFGVAAANRDPNVFPEPDRFDITRNTKTLLSFGPGLRTCPGMHLAQKNLACALKIMAQRFPDLRLVQSARPEGVLLRGVPQLKVCLY